MPELPEVETVRRSASLKICNKKIQSVTVHNDDVLDGIDIPSFTALLTDHAVTEIKRHGKYLLFCLDGGAEILLHLRMTGQLICFDEDFESDRHCHVVIRFAQGGFYYRDVRRFGRFCVIGSGGKTEAGYRQLGFEPLERGFTLNYFSDGVKRHQCAVKTRLLDQHFIAGIGNIYADEILFAAGVNPEKPCNELTNCQIKRIKKASEEILKEAIEHRGTTFRDFRDGYGENGGHQDHLKVFHRQGEPCPLCGTTIQSVKCGGRTTSFCPHCQKR